jgi:hypothetical protein
MAGQEHDKSKPSGSPRWEAVVAAADEVDEKLRTRGIRRPYWVQAGDQTWGLVVEGRVTTLVYWTDSQVGELDEPGGDPVVVDPAWYWFSVDDPDHHYMLSGVETPAGDMSYEELVATRDHALETALREIRGERGGR